MVLDLQYFFLINCYCYKWSSTFSYEAQFNVDYFLHREVKFNHNLSFTMILKTVMCLSSDKYFRAYQCFQYVKMRLPYKVCASEMYLLERIQIFNTVLIVIFEKYLYMTSKEDIIHVLEKFLFMYIEGKAKQLHLLTVCFLLFFNKKKMLLTNFVFLSVFLLTS